MARGVAHPRGGRDDEPRQRARDRRRRPRRHGAGRDRHRHVRTDRHRRQRHPRGPHEPLSGHHLDRRRRSRLRGGRHDSRGPGGRAASGSGGARARISVPAGRGRHPHGSGLVARPSSALEARDVTALVNPEFWARLLGIILIAISLAGDNALVIALAVRELPPRQQLLGRIWGTVGAVGLRVAFIVVVSLLLSIPLLQLAGGLALIWIAVRLVRPGQGGHGGARQGTSLREAIWIIIVADVTMSLDNVLGVAAAAKGNMVLVVLGIALSLPLVVWGSGLLAALMARHEWIVWLGGGVLGYVAGEMMTDDPVVQQWLGPAAKAADLWLSLVLGVFVLALGWWLARTATRRGGE